MKTTFIKQITLLVIVISFAFLQSTYSQVVTSGAITIDENTIIKDESGKKIDVFKSIEMMQSGKWTMEPINDSEGKLLYMQLKKLSEKEQKMAEQFFKQQNSNDFIGKEAPDFSLTDMNGNVISSENTKGKVVVLNFWFTTCKPCIAEIPELNNVYEKFKNNPDVIFASITFNKKKRVEDFLKIHPIKYPTVINAQNTCDTFKILGYPTNIVIDKNGRYFYLTSGGLPQIDSDLISAIQNALKDKAPEIKPSTSNEMIIEENATFKLENGEKISFDKAIELLNSNKYNLIDKKNENNEKYYLLKKID